MGKEIKKFKRKFACADFSFPLLSHDQVLDLICSLNFEGIDIGLFEKRGHIQPSQIIKNIVGSARDLSRRVADRGLTLSDIFPHASTEFDDVAINHYDPRVRKRMGQWFKQMLEFTIRTGATHMTILPGVAWKKKEPYRDSLKRCADELAWRVALAADMGVVLSVEPHLGSIISTPKQAAQLIKITSGLTLTLDYGHFICQGFLDRDVAPLIKYASHFHARCACKGRLQSPLKNNAINYPRVLRSLKRTGYTGFLSIEYVWIDWERCNEVDNLCETILLRDLLKAVTL